MILKSMSTTRSGTLLRYILRVKKTKSRTYEYQNEKVFQKYKGHKDLYIYGIKVSERDLQNLHSERVDAQLLFDLKNFKGSMTQFIENLMTSSGNAKQSKEEVAVIHTHNLKSREISGFEKEFKSNEANRIHKSSRQIAATHFIISWNHKETNITDKMLQSMAKEFVRLRGDSNLYVFTKHAEQGKPIHLHVAMSATKLNGMSNRISKSEFATLKLSMDAFQREHYSLIYSLPQHGKSKNSKAFDKEVMKNIKIADRASVKNELLKYVESANISSLSTKQFFSQLEKQGFKTYSRNGRMTGLQHENGLKFRFSRLNIDLEKMQQRDATMLKEEESLKKLRDTLHKSKIRSGNELNLKQSKIDRLENLNPHPTKFENKASTVEQENKAAELTELSNLRTNTNTIEKDIDDDLEDSDNGTNGQDDLKDNMDDNEPSAAEEPIFNNE